MWVYVILINNNKEEEESIINDGVGRDQWMGVLSSRFREKEKEMGLSVGSSDTWRAKTQRTS